MNFNRRRFLRRAGAAGLAWSVRSAVVAAPAESRATYPTQAGLPDGWRAMKKFDAHAHVFAFVHRPGADWSTVEAMLEAADALGIQKLFCSHPITAGALANIDVVRDANDSVLAAMRRYPGRIVGYCFVQPGNGPAALEEIDRCAAAGMIGVKLYNQFKFSDPALFPIAEKCMQRRLLFLGHSGHLTDSKTQAAQPHISDARDFGVLARRYPELKMILGHLGGGGDWEWTVRELRECPPNLHVDTSGSVMEDDMIGDCVRAIGHERVLFATDMTMEGGVGKVLSADLTPAQREDIFWRNYQRLLDGGRS